MQPTSQFQHLPYFNYYQPALPKVFWNNHKYRSEMAAYMLTIPQTLLIEKEANFLRFQVVGQPLASLNAEPISNDFNQGPYIDVVSYSLLNRSQCANVSDSLPSTPVGRFSQATLMNNSMQFNHNLDFNITSSRQVTTQVDRLEFENVTYQNDDKKTLVFKMKTCFLGRDHQEYDISDLTSLRNSKLAARASFGSLCVGYGWCGGFLHFPDMLYSPPASASSSFGVDWTVCYLPPVEGNLELEWTTEVRVVYASNEYNTNYQNAMGEYINWIKTAHIIKQVFQVINSADGIGIHLISNNVKQICSTGYDKTTVAMVLKRDEEETILSETQAKEHCFIPI